MSIIINSTVLLLLTLTCVQSLNILSEGRTDDLTARRKIMDVLVNNLSNTRRNSRDPKALSKAREMFKKLAKNMAPGDLKRLLRKNDKPTEIIDQQADLVEKELKKTLRNKHSALLDRPYVEKKGRNDFLVMGPDLSDAFVTIIPNAIYYNAEKKCVNWLDDCSIKGIRARLLKGVNSPYK